MPTLLKMMRNRMARVKGKQLSKEYLHIITFFRFLNQLFGKNSIGERAMQKLAIPTVSRKICAFSEDEKTLVIVT